MLRKSPPVTTQRLAVTHINRPAIAFIVFIYQNMSNKTTNGHTKIAENPSLPPRHELSDTPIGLTPRKNGI
jgi:hypothetical protein